MWLTHLILLVILRYVHGCVSDLKFIYKRDYIQELEIDLKQEWCIDVDQEIDNVKRKYFDTINIYIDDTDIGSQQHELRLNISCSSHSSRSRIVNIIAWTDKVMDLYSGGNVNLTNCHFVWKPMKFNLKEDFDFISQQNENTTIIDGLQLSGKFKATFQFNGSIEFKNLDIKQTSFSIVQFQPQNYDLSMRDCTFDEMDKANQLILIQQPEHVKVTLIGIKVLNTFLFDNYTNLFVIQHDDWEESNGWPLGSHSIVTIDGLEVSNSYIKSALSLNVRDVSIQKLTISKVTTYQYQDSNLIWLIAQNIDIKELKVLDLVLINTIAEPQISVLIFISQESQTSLKIEDVWISGILFRCTEKKTSLDLNGFGFEGLRFEGESNLFRIKAQILEVNDMTIKGSMSNLYLLTLGDVMDSVRFSNLKIIGQDLHLMKQIIHITCRTFLIMDSIIQSTRPMLSGPTNQESLFKVVSNDISFKNINLVSLMIQNQPFFELINDRFTDFKLDLFDFTIQDLIVFDQADPPPAFIKINVLKSKSEIDIRGISISRNVMKPIPTLITINIQSKQASILIQNIQSDQDGFLIFQSLQGTRNIVHIDTINIHFIHPNNVPLPLFSLTNSRVEMSNVRTIDIQQILDCKMCEVQIKEVNARFTLPMQGKLLQIIDKAKTSITQFTLVSNTQSKDVWTAANAVFTIQAKDVRLSKLVFQMYCQFCSAQGPMLQDLPLIVFQATKYSSILTFNQVRYNTFQERTLLQILSPSLFLGQVLIDQVTARASLPNQNPLFNLMDCEVKISKLQTTNIQQMIECYSCTLIIENSHNTFNTSLQGKLIESRNGSVLSIRGFTLIQRVDIIEPRIAQYDPLFALDSQIVTLSNVMMQVYSCTYCSTFMTIQGNQIKFQQISIVGMPLDLDIYIEPNKLRSTDLSMLVFTSSTLKNLYLTTQDISVIRIQMVPIQGNGTGQTTLVINSASQVMIKQLTIFNQQDAQITIDSLQVALESIVFLEISAQINTMLLLKSWQIIVTRMTLINISQQGDLSLIQASSYKSFSIANLKLLNLIIEGSIIRGQSNVNASSTFLNSLTLSDVFGQTQPTMQLDTNIIKMQQIIFRNIKGVQCLDLSLLNSLMITKLAVLESPWVQVLSSHGAQTTNVDLNSIIIRSTFQLNRLTSIEIVNFNSLTIQGLMLSLNNQSLQMKLENISIVSLLDIRQRSANNQILQLLLQNISQQITIRRLSIVHQSSMQIQTFKNPPSLSISIVDIISLATSPPKQLVDSFLSALNIRVRLKNLLFFQSHSLTFLVSLSNCSVIIIGLSAVKGTGSTASILGSNIYMRDTYISNRQSNQSQIHVEGGTISLERQIFINCSIPMTGTEQGGALCLENVRINFFHNVSFIANSAPVGGALAYISAIPQSFQTPYFRNNHARLPFSDNLVMNPQGARILLNNITQFDKMFDQGSSRSFIASISIKSGQSLSISLIHLQSYSGSIEEYDLEVEFNYTLKYIEWSETKYLTRSNVVQYARPVKYEQTITLKRKPGLLNFSNASISINFTDIRCFNQLIVKFLDNSIRKPSTLQFSIGFKPCDPGDYLDQFLICQPCPKATYSLDFDSLNCTRCKIQQICEQGIITGMADGYWRQTNETDVFEECVNRPGNCISDQNSICIAGHIGPLCESCDFFGDHSDGQYFETSKYQCSNCSEMHLGLSITLLVGGILLFLLFNFGLLEISRQGMQKKTTVELLRQLGFVNLGNSGFTSIQAVYIKILSYHLLILGILSTVNPDDEFSQVSRSVEYSSKVSDVQTNFFTCYFFGYLNRQQPISIIILLSMVVCIIAIFGLYFLIFAIFSKFKLTALLKRQIYFTCVYLYQYFLPKFSQQLFIRVSCREITGTYYCSDDLIEPCFSLQPNLLRGFVILPLIILLDMMLPLKLYRQVKQLQILQANKTPNYQKQMIFSIFYKEYTSEFYHFDILKTSLKLLILFLVNFLESFPIYKILSTVQILAIYAVIISRKNPYIMLQFYRLDLASQCILINSLIMGIALRQVASQTIRIILMFAMMVLNFGFIAILILLLFRLKIRQALRMMYFIQIKVVKTRSRWV